MKKDCFKDCFCSKAGFIKGCHSRGFLSGISRILSSCRCKKDVIPNLIWDLPRPSLPLHLRNNLRGRWQDPVLRHSGARPAVMPRSAMTPLLNKRGFTLIELLVVVLIIGILAAVALPQYQKAAEKARAVEAFTFMKSLSDAANVYYLANGSYEGMELDNVDIGVNPDMLQYFNLAFGGEWVYEPGHADIIFRRGGTTGANSLYVLVSTLRDGRTASRYCYSANGYEGLCNSLGATDCEASTQCYL